MADTQLALASRVQKWNSDFWTEYVRDTRFRPFMGRADGDGAMMPIITKYDLAAGGKTVNMPLITRLKGSGVQGVTRLTGNEEAMANFNFPIQVNWNRNGVKISKPEEHWTEMDLRRAARMVLKTWASESLRDDIITAMLAYAGTSFLAGKDQANEGDNGLTPLQAYQALSEATKNAWLAANGDRFLFGAAVANNASSNHANSLLNVDTTNDRLNARMVSLAKSVALEAGRVAAFPSGRNIRPFKTNDAEGREWFVMFVGSRGFRDLKRDSVIENANRDARPRDVSANPIFQDGDLIWDGVIIREVPEIPVLAGVGASTSDVQPAFLCGAQAVSVAWGQEPASRTKKEDDYGFEYGVAIEECRGVAKNVFNGVQHGMVNVFYSAPAAA
jgi:hypothetical protein